MSDDNKTNRPSDSLTSNMPSRNGMSAQANLPWIILAVIILVVIVVGVLFRDRLFPKKGANNMTAEQKEQKSSGYQAVFLTNGQVYFGKLSDMSATYATLSDIYYLQVTQPPIQGSQQQGQQAAAAQQQLSLVKLGQELHGPVDEMKINRDQILFFEDIKEDGRVMTAIREYQKNPPAPAAQTPQTQTPATTTPAANEQKPATK
jgi:hypothetical protein